MPNCFNDIHVMALLPLAATLLSIALGPQLLHCVWDSARRRPMLLALCAFPALAAQVTRASMPHSVMEYLAFMALLTCLYIVAGGLAVVGTFKQGAGTNTVLLACGTALASLIGTTGASMLLIRPILSANRHRQHQAHVVVYFIILVSNIGGLLLPIGDPPLFMGYLRGVPFFWTLRLWPAWAVASGTLLTCFFALDLFLWRHKEQAVFHAGKKTQTPWHLRGKLNLVFLAVAVAVVAGAPALSLGALGQSVILFALATLSWATTAKDIHHHNNLSWGPLIEVGQVFAAIFLTLPLALAELGRIAPELPLSSLETVFWLTGTLSSVLDNAPCYLTFASLGAQRLGGTTISLTPLLSDHFGQLYLAAVSQGAVMMGAMTYVGNGPNLMVRAMAQAQGIKTPSFFGYIGWTLLTLVPVLMLVRLVA